MNKVWHEYNDKVSGFSSNHWYSNNMEGIANHYITGGGVNGEASGTWIGMTSANHYGGSVYHEYTHNVIYRTNGHWLGHEYYEDGRAMDEGLSDYYSCSFRNDPIRYASDRRLDGKMKYPGTGGAHTRGQIIGGACWDLQSKSGMSANYVNGLVYESVANLGFEEQFGDFFDDMLLADDNDGNVTNGTPHSSQICDAFVTDHAIVGSYLAGTIKKDIILNNTVTLIGDLTIDNGMTLTINSGNTVWMNGHSIKCNGTGKIVKNGNVYGYQHYATSSSYYKGFFPSSTSVNQIIDWSSSGWNIYMGSGTQSLTKNTTVPADVTLNLSSGTTLYLMNYYIKCSGSGKIVNDYGGTISGYKHWAAANDYKGFFPSSTTIQQIINWASSGWGIHIGYGTYSENISMKYNVGLYGDWSNTTTINGQVNFYNDDHATLDNFTVNGKISISSSDDVYISEVKSGNANCYIDSYSSQYEVVDSEFEESQTNGFLVRGDVYGFYVSIKNKTGNGMVLIDGATADLEDVMFCDNYWDIMTVAGATADCDYCEFSGETEGSTVGYGVDYNNYWEWCYSSKSLAKSSDADPVINVSSQDDSLAKQDFHKAMDSYRSIRTLLREDRKAEKQLEPAKYKSDYDEAIGQFKQVVENYPNSTYSRLSLNKISTSHRALAEYDDLSKYMLELANNKNYELLRPYSLNALIPSYIDQEESQKAIELSNLIIDEYPNHELVVELLYGKGLIYKYDLKDTEKAAKMFSLVIVNYSDHYTAFSAAGELESLGKEYIAEDLAPTEISNELMVENYPNPFNPSTTIKFNLPEAGNVLIQVYNISGQLVSTLVDNYLESGFHNVDFNGKQLSSGIYIYKFTSGKFTVVKRMLLIK